MSAVIQLKKSQIPQAERLVTSAIPAVDFVSVGRTQDHAHVLCRDFLAQLGRAQGTPVILAEDIWLGVTGQGGKLVAALHAAPLFGSATRHIEALYRGAGEVFAGSPSWIARLLNEVLMVEEVAVLPTGRRRGHGAALLAECHRIARGRDVQHLQAHAGSASAQALFKSAGYIVGPARTPVPSQYQSGLGTLWDPINNRVGGSYVYNHIEELS